MTDTQPVPVSGQAEVNTAAAKLVYEESKTANTDLDEILKSFRSNSTVVLGVLTGAATLFALGDSTKGVLFWLAILGYTAAALCVAWIFWPVGWQHNFARGGPEALLAATDEVNETQALIDLSKARQAGYRVNAGVILDKTGIASRFALLVGLTAVTVLLLLANAALGQTETKKEPTRVVIVTEDT